jgi:phage-related holin
LTTGFIFSFFVPIKGFLLFTVAVVFADTITGIKAAKKEGQKISSKGLYRTTEKIVVYFVAILIFEGAKNTFNIPFPITYMVAMMISGTELFSVAENIKRITGVELGTLISRFFKR